MNDAINWEDPNQVVDAWLSAQRYLEDRLEGVLVDYQTQPNVQQVAENAVATVNFLGLPEGWAERLAQQYLVNFHKGR